MSVWWDKIVYKKSILKDCIQSYFLHGSIFCLGICMSVSKPSICFGKRVIWIEWRNKLFIHNINLTSHRKSACCLQLLVFLEYESLLRFGIGGPKFFPRVAATMISKRFVKLGIKVYLWILQKIWSKDDSYIFYRW